MAKHGKKYNEAMKLVDRESLYPAKQAISILKSMPSAKFDESVDVAFRLGVDPRHADQQIRNALVLPHGTGQTRSVLVFAGGEKAKEAEAAGADFVGAEDMIEKIQQGWLDFDVAVATPDMMAQVGKIGRILGPKGLMPNPKTGTVTMDVTKAVEEIKAGKIEYRVEKAGIVHATIGKKSFTEEQLYDNLVALYDALLKARPEAVKGIYMRSIAISSTMSPGVPVDPDQVVGE